MNEPGLVLQAGFGLAAGIVLGIVHFGLLWWNTQLFARRGSALTAFAVQFGRFALLVAVLAMLARLGALPLLAGALGLLIARPFVVKRLGAAG